MRCACFPSPALQPPSHPSSPDTCSVHCLILGGLGLGLIKAMYIHSNNTLLSVAFLMVWHSESLRERTCLGWLATILESSKENRKVAMIVQN